MPVTVATTLTHLQAPHPGLPGKKTSSSSLMNTTISSTISCCTLVSRVGRIFCIAHVPSAHNNDGKIKCDWEPFVPCTGSFSNSFYLRQHCKDVDGLYHTVFLTYVDKLNALAQAGERERARLTSTAAEEEQSDHFEKKELPKLPLFEPPPELPPHVHAQGT